MFAYKCARKSACKLSRRLLRIVHHDLVNVSAQRTVERPCRVDTVATWVNYLFAECCKWGPVTKYCEYMT